MRFVRSSQSISFASLFLATFLGASPALGATSTAGGDAALTPATRTALVDAMADERNSEVFYQAVIDRFGAIQPFSNIVSAEQRHADALDKIGQKYGVEFSENIDPVAPAVPDTVKEACGVAVEAEKRNIAMYDRLLSDLREPDIRQTFERLQTASRDHHLPAFTRCVEAGGVTQTDRAQSAPGSCGECGMGGACGCSSASEGEKKARAAAGGGCGCAKRAREGM